MTACGACGRRVRRPQRCGKRAPRCRSPSQSCDRVFHAAGRIHRPSATIRPTRMPQERRSRRRPTCAPPRRSPWTGHGVAFADVFGAAFVRRIEGPFSSMRCVSWSNRSQIASAWLGSPITPCQSVTGSWQAMMPLVTSLLTRWLVGTPQGAVRPAPLDSALDETTRGRGHLRQLDNQLGEHWKIGTLAAALGVHQETVRRRAAARDGRPPPRA